jgi:hypothetical protein
MDFNVKRRAHIIVGFELVECLRAIGEFGNRENKGMVNQDQFTQ